MYSPKSRAVMPRFTEQVESAVEALSANPSQPVDENEFIDASRLVYDGIRDIRKAVLMIRVSCIIFLISLVQYIAYFLFFSLRTSHFHLSFTGLREMSCCSFFPVLKLRRQNVGCFSSGLGPLPIATALCAYAPDAVVGNTCETTRAAGNSVSP